MEYIEKITLSPSPSPRSLLLSPSPLPFSLPPSPLSLSPPLSPPLPLIPPSPRSYTQRLFQEAAAPWTPRSNGRTGTPFSGKFVLFVRTLIGGLQALGGIPSFWL